MATRYTASDLTYETIYNYLTNARVQFGNSIPNVGYWNWYYFPGNASETEGVDGEGNPTVTYNFVTEYLTYAEDGPTIAQTGETITSYMRNTVTNDIPQGSTLGAGPRFNMANAAGLTLVPGDVYRFRASVRAPVGTSYKVYARTYYGNGTYADAALATVYNGTGDWNIASVNLTYPSTTNIAVGFALWLAFQGTIPSGSVIDMTAGIVTEDVITSGLYFADGDTPNTTTLKTSWLGGVGTSTTRIDRFSGASTGIILHENFDDWSLVESATSQDPGDFQGGTTQFTVKTPYSKNSRKMLGMHATFDDDVIGDIQGTVRQVATSGRSTAEFTNDTNLALLNSWQTVKPFRGSFAAAMGYLFAIVSIPAPSVPSDMVSKQVYYPGFTGNLYDKIKQILAAEALELTIIGDQPVMRHYGDITRALPYLTSEPEFNVSVQETSKKVRIHYYGNTYRANYEVWPVKRSPAEIKDNPDAEEPEATVFSVDANEILETEVTLNASLFSVNQPQYVSSVPDEVVTSGTGKYTAAGNDGLPITPTQWAAQGGKLTVSIGSSPNILKIKIVGPSNTALAPYRIAMSSGSGNYYNALHVTGTALFVDDNYVDLYTGGYDSLTGEELGAEVTNPYIATASQAYNVGQYTAGKQAMQQDTSFAMATFLEPDATIGYLAGSRFPYNGAYHRVESATANPTTISAQTTPYTTIADFNTRYAGLTMTQFNALWPDADLIDFSIAPLIE